MLTWQSLLLTVHFTTALRFKWCTAMPFTHGSSKQAHLLPYAGSSVMACGPTDQHYLRYPALGQASGSPDASNTLGHPADTKGIVMKGYGSSLQMLRDSDDLWRLHKT